MKTFKQHIKEYKGYAGDAQGIGTTGYANPIEDGSDGQIKTIINVSTSGTNNIVITPANLRGYTTITLNAPGETVTCLFKNSNWNVIAGNGYALA